MTMQAATTTLQSSETYRDDIASRLPLDRIWTVPWREIETFEVLPGSPLESDVWILPPDWASSGRRQLIGARTLDFSWALPATWNRDCADSVSHIRRLKRLAVLLFTQTLRLQEQVRKPPRPSTWMMMMKRLLRIACDVAQMTQAATKPTSCPDARPIFANINPEQFGALSKKHRAFFEAETPRLNALFRHGHFDDWPAGDVCPAERLQKKRKWQPFADEFTALVGHAALWMVEDLGPDILDCWEGITRLRAHSSNVTNPKTARRDRLDYIKQWSGKTLNESLRFKYHFRVTGSDGQRRISYTLSSWADIQPAAVDDLARILQDAHAAVMSLSFGPRNGELSELARDCLREASNGTLLRGYTFKLAEDREERDWPLPTAAVAAIRQQQRLAEILDPGGKRLFVAFNRNSKRVKERNRDQINASGFTDAVYTPDGHTISSYCNGNVHSHRYRKTISRLAALSLVGANQILFDILGHRDPEMTLNYILSDPELQDEMRKIAREATYVIAKEAVQQANENGGPAAGAVSDLVWRFKARSAEKELDETSLQTVAMILSQNGRVMLAGKNRLCTKALNQAGPCNASIGTPDIGNCQIDCVHRLELAAAKHDHRLAIMQSLDEIEKADGMMRIWWQGQIVAHLHPFKDLASELMGSPRLQRALEGMTRDELRSLTQLADTTGPEVLEKSR